MTDFTRENANVFSDTQWGLSVVRMLSRYGLPDDVWIEDSSANPWRVFISNPHTSSNIIIRMMFFPMYPPLIEVETAPLDSGVFEVVERYIKDLSCCFSPAMIPPSIVLDLYSRMLAVRILAERNLTDDEWDLVPLDSDIGHLLPAVLARDGLDATAKLVSRLPEEKRKVLENAMLCLSRFVSRDLVERIAVQCV